MRIKQWLAACVALACSFAFSPGTLAADETGSAAGTNELSEIVVTACSSDALFADSADTGPMAASTAGASCVAS